MKNTPITTQIKSALKAENRLASGLGFVLGAVTPILVFVSTHSLPDLQAYSLEFLVFLIMGLCGMYCSMKSVIQWMLSLTGGDKIQSIGYAISLEGMLVMSGMVPKVAWVGYLALAYLVLINAISKGCGILLSQKEHNREVRTPKKAKKK